jgi:hypothetical protein
MYPPQNRTVFRPKVYRTSAVHLTSVPGTSAHDQIKQCESAEIRSPIAWM